MRKHILAIVLVAASGVANAYQQCDPREYAEISAMSNAELLSYYAQLGEIKHSLDRVSPDDHEERWAAQHVCDAEADKVSRMAKRRNIPWDTLWTAGPNTMLLGTGSGYH